MVTKGLLVRLEAKTGHERDVENFLREALADVDAEPKTTTWFALRFGPASFGIFDAFVDDEGRDAHLNGKVTAALMQRAEELLAEPPKVERADVLAAKLPALAQAGAGQGS